MNTHLHILEPYTNLYRVWKSPELRERIVDLLDIFFNKVKSPTNHHLRLFFDENWHPTSSQTYSYGHDIEASWLLLEAATVLSDNSLVERIKPECRKIASAALEGYLPDGSLAYERKADGSLDAERHWWVQAESEVGLAWLFACHGLSEYLPMMNRTWQYILDNLVDNSKGEWFWSIKENGSVNLSDDKAGFWKCPYHNSRMCLELVQLARHF